jgi:uncharacterized protein (TIGR02001 family)
MKKSLLATLVAGSILGWAAVASADQDPLIPAPEGKFIGNVTAVTEYWARGLRQTNGGVGAIQGSVEYDHPSGVYLGAWGSNTQLTPSPLDSNPSVRANAEMDFSAGYRNTFSFDDKATYDVGLIYYYYPGTQHAQYDFDWVDAMAKVGYDFGFAAPTVKLLVSPDMQYESGNAEYIALDVPVPVGSYFTVTPHVGYQWIDKNARYGTPDYMDYGLSIGTNIAGLDMAIQYVSTDRRKSACGTQDCGGFVFSVGKTF